MHDHNKGIYIGLWRIAPQKDYSEEVVSEREIIRRGQPRRKTQILRLIGNALIMAGSRLKT